jgi:hypothetical protein
LKKHPLRKHQQQNCDNRTLLHSYHNEVQGILVLPAGIVVPALDRRLSDLKLPQ